MAHALSIRPRGTIYLQFKNSISTRLLQILLACVEVDLEHRVHDSLFVKLHATTVVYLLMRELIAPLIRISIEYLVAEWIRHVPCKHSPPL